MSLPHFPNHKFAMYGDTLPKFLYCYNCLSNKISINGKSINNRSIKTNDVLKCDICGYRERARKFRALSIPDRNKMIIQFNRRNKILKIKYKI
ncbi:MAG: hypothetical protein WDA02_06840 [Saccharofermentanales bacterium]